MVAQPTSPLPAVFFYEDVDTTEIARQCTFFDNACNGEFIIYYYTLSIAEYGPT